jgi:hypothetical protein
MNKPIALSIIFLFSTLLLVSCEQTENQVPSPPIAGNNTLVTVNGKAISQAEVDHELRNRKGHDNDAVVSQERTNRILKNLIQKELKAQKALQLGLDNDEKYQLQMLGLNAQVNAFKRDKLADLFEAREIIARATVSDLQIEQFIEENKEQLHTNLHILQLLNRNEAVMQEISKKLVSGVSFDDVAAEQFPDLPSEFKRPWDLGYLRWDQIPDAWVPALENMKPGESSDIIRGANRRFWVIHLVDRTLNDEFDLNQSKGKIIQILKQRQIQKLKEQAMSTLNDQADIVYPKNGNN